MHLACNVHAIMQSSTQERKDIEPSRSMHMHTHNNTQCSLCYTSTLAAALSSQGALLRTVFIITGLRCQRRDSGHLINKGNSELRYCISCKASGLIYHCRHWSYKELLGRRRGVQKHTVQTTNKVSSLGVSQLYYSIVQLFDHERG